MPEEEITGAWILDNNGDAIADDSERRIGELIRGYVRIADRDAGWTVLFKNPLTGEHWELIYPHGEMQGGGPRRLSRLSRSEVTNRYPLISPL